ncbi:ATP-binding protein [Streptomyces syringium]|uniref:ATP-binding protein n=1 Tax=Streptomyces syringium TaxID=76729 RepID=UPI003D9295BF
MTLPSALSAGVLSPLATPHPMKVSFPPDPRRVEQMRRLTAAHLKLIGGITPDKIHAVQLLVSELVTNAIQHGDQRTEVDLLLTWASPAKFGSRSTTTSPGDRRSRTLARATRAAED